MSLIESQAAAIFHADLLTPLRRARLQHGSSYLDCGARRESYWQPIISRTGGIERLSASQCNFPEALRLLEQYWSKHNERDLLQLVAHLDRLYRDLAASGTPKDTEAALPEYVYPLF